MAQFTFVTAMSVQACLHVGYRNEPNKIEKGQLCQKLTYSQQPTGGGRVLSVILAGTLAMGMTPAVALTTESLQPMQAFAADETATGALSYDGDLNLGAYGDVTAPDNTKFSLKATINSQTETDIPNPTIVIYNNDKKTGDPVTIDNTTPAGSYYAFATGTTTYESTPGDDTTTVTVNVSTTTPVVFSIDKAEVALNLDTTSLKSDTRFANTDAGKAAAGEFLSKLATLDPAVEGLSANVTVSAIADGDTLTTQKLTYTESLAGTAAANYKLGGTPVTNGEAVVTVPAPAMSSINASQASEFSNLTITEIAYNGNGATYSGQTTPHAPNASELTVMGTYEVSGGQEIPVQINLDSNYVIQVVNADGNPVQYTNAAGEKVNGAVNADTYGIKVVINSASGTEIASDTLPASYTIAPATLSIKPSGAVVLGGDDQKSVEAAFAVDGVQPGDTNVYTLALSGDGWNTTTNEAVAGKAITATINKTTTEPAASNYTVATPATGSNVVTVLNGITIAGETYAVSMQPTKACNENWNNGVNPTYSYNGAAQAPKVVFTNVNPASQNKTPASGYSLWYAENNAGVTGSTNPPTAQGTYNVFVKVDGQDLLKIGSYTITPASIADSNQVAIKWNGQLLNGATQVTKVSMNYVDQWSDALTLTYPSSNITVAYPAEYSVEVTEGTGIGTIAIAPKSGSNTSTNLVGSFGPLTYTIAYGQLSRVTMSASFSEEPTTYIGKEIEIDADDVVVYDARGNELPQTSTLKDGTQVTNWSISQSDNINAGTSTVTITGQGNYAGEVSTTFEIKPCDISALTFTPAYTTTVYSSLAQEPAIGVSAGKSGITSATDFAQDITAKDNKNPNFAVAYSNNINRSTPGNPAVATITATGKNYVGTTTVDFTITPYQLNNIKSSSIAANVAFTSAGAAYPANVLEVTSGLTTKGDVPVPMVEGRDYDVVSNTAQGGTTQQAWNTITWGANDEQKQVYYAIVGKGNYEGTITTGSYYVTKNSLVDFIQRIDHPEIYFNGTAQTPDITVYPENNGASFIIKKSQNGTKANKGLVVTYSNNRNASSDAVVNITASGTDTGELSGTAYYSDTQSYKFTIQPSDLTEAKFALLAPEAGGTTYSYTGSQIKPGVSTDKEGTAALAAGFSTLPRGVITTKIGTVIAFENIADEYNISYGANVAVTNKKTDTNWGTVTIVPTSANMTKSATAEFEIAAAQITKDDVHASSYGVYKKQANGATYAEPEVTVVVNGRTLVRNVDYTLTVSNKQTVGNSATYTIEGKGNYAGTYSDQFLVVNDIAEATVTLPQETYVYDGTAKEPVPVVTFYSDNKTLTLTPVTDYTVSYENNIAAGTATVVITGTGKTNLTTGQAFGGTIEKTFTIEQAEGELAITGKVADYAYNGSAATPEPDFTFTVGTNVMTKADLEAGVDYKYVYANNVNATAVTGKKASVTVQMLGNYGAKTPAALEFTIAQANVANADVVVGDVVVGGTPKVAVSMDGRALKQGTDFTFTADTKTAGTKTATITGKGNYTGTQKVTFTVLKENQVLPDDTDLTGGTWAKVDGKWQYTTKDGKLVSSGWAEINGQWYYFDTNGNAKTGWFDDNGTWYYLNTASDKGTECAMVSNAWKKINGNWYHFAKSGAMQTGWQKINGAWYYLNKKGEGTEGAMQTGWQKINGAWYYLNKAGQGTEGAMKTGWFNDNGTWYYLLTAAEGTEGKMVSNQWMQINGSWFYFYAGGAMAANTWVGNYYVDANGYWVR